VTGTVLAAAAAARVPAALVAGSIAAGLAAGRWHAVSLSELAGSAAAAQADPARWLRLAGRLVAADRGSGTEASMRT
jgi:glycerate kinase